MIIKGIKRGQTIELLEPISSIPDGSEIVINLSISATEKEEKSICNNEEKLKRLNQLFGIWQEQPELTEIFAKIDTQRHAYQGRLLTLSGLKPRRFYIHRQNLLNQVFTK